MQDYTAGNQTQDIKSSTFIPNHWLEMAVLIYLSLVTVLMENPSVGSINHPSKNSSVKFKVLFS